MFSKHPLRSITFLPVHLHSQKQIWKIKRFNVNLVYLRIVENDTNIMRIGSIEQNFHSEYDLQNMISKSYLKNTVASNHYNLRRNSKVLKKYSVVRYCLGWKIFCIKILNACIIHVIYWSLRKEKYEILWILFRKKTVY